MSVNTNSFGARAKRCDQVCKVVEFGSAVRFRSIDGEPFLKEASITEANQT